MYVHVYNELSPQLSGSLKSRQMSLSWRYRIDVVRDVKIYHMKTLKLCQSLNIHTTGVINLLISNSLLAERTYRYPGMTSSHVIISLTFS